MRICSACGAHVRIEDPTCPSCATVLRGSVSSVRLGLTALGGLALFACATETDPMDTGSGGTTTMMSGTTADVTTDATTETGDGDDTTTGDGDGDGDGDGGLEPAYGVPTGVPCEEFGAEPVSLGANALQLSAEGPGIVQTCGAIGSGLYSFMIPATGDYEFALTDADFDAVISLVFGTCEPPLELTCALAPESTTLHRLPADVLLYIVVGDPGMKVDGTATLTITSL